MCGKRPGNSPTGKDSSDWSKVTYLNGPAKSSHTVPQEERAWMIREMVSRAQGEEDEADRLKILVLKTLQWNPNVLDAVIYLFCGRGRKMTICHVGKSRDAVTTVCTEAFLAK